MFKIIYKIIYFAALAVCGIFGAKKIISNDLFATKNKAIKFLLMLLLAFLSAFGGGLTRDLVFLHTHPAVLTISSLPDIIVAVSAAMWYYYSPKIRNVIRNLNLIIIIIDAAGMGTFISIGVSKAVESDSSPFVIFCCGCVTAIGGGIITSIFTVDFRQLLINSKSYVQDLLKKSRFQNTLYRLIAALCSFIYSEMIEHKTTVIIADAIIILLTLSFILISRQKRHKIYVYIPCSTCTYTYICLFILSMCWFCVVFYHFKLIKKLCNIKWKSIRRQRTIIYHRILA